LYNVQASPEWTEPPTNILHARPNALILYDKDYVAILTELSTTAKKWLSTVSAHGIAAAAAAGTNGVGHHPAGQPP
ncbi:hypothetical protein LB320_14950, partial [Staphylococcus aureus]|nr:hypothetical protein [Staphylococcus aureus]